MKVKTRIGLGFAIVLLVTFATSIVAWVRLDAVAQATSKMMQAPLTKERFVSDWSSNVQSATRRTIAIAKSSDSSLADFFAADAVMTSTQSTELQGKVEKMLDTEQEKSLFATIADKRKAFLATRSAIAKLKTDGKMEEANVMLDKTFMPLAKEYMALMEQLLAEERNQIDKTAKDIETIYQQSRVMLLIMSIAALGCGIVCTTVLTKGLLKQLGGEPDYAAAIANNIANGDLKSAVETKPNDQSSLLYAMSVMRNSLAKIVMEVRTATDTIATASREVASGNLDLSSRTEQQASSLEETASSMEELTSTVKHNAENAREANRLAFMASDVAMKGGAVVSEVVDTMVSINESSKKIADIISVIDGIAFQTNILALNAAVEAARAGEQGRGFAVVASEVRSLAQRSAAAAKEIKTLINDSVEKVGTGAKLVDQAGATMGEIVESVKRVTDIMSEIMAASQEQSSGIEQVNQAVSQMDQVTQQNASLVEQAAAAAEAMEHQAKTLAEVVSVFTLADTNAPSTSRQHLV